MTVTQPQEALATPSEAGTLAREMAAAVRGAGGVLRPATQEGARRGGRPAGGVVHALLRGGGPLPGRSGLLVRTGQSGSAGCRSGGPALGAGQGRGPGRGAERPPGGPRPGRAGAPLLAEGASPGAAAGLDG